MTVIQLGPVVSRIVVDVDQKLGGVAAEQFDVDLLPWEIPVQE